MVHLTFQFKVYSISLPNIHLPNLVNDRSLGSFDDSFVVGSQVDGTQYPPMSRASMHDPIHMPNLPPQQMRLMTL
jgi:hypothetical protein